VLFQLNAFGLNFEESNHIAILETADTATMTTKLPDLDTALAGLEITSSLKACLFRKFPPEVREIIFDEAIEWDGKTPALIVALRGDPVLYFEALEVLSKSNVFIMSKKNEETRRSMPSSVYKNIQRLWIEIPEYESMSRLL
jgi:hypothetical protein